MYPATKISDDKFNRFCADLYDLSLEQVRLVEDELRNIRELHENKIRREIRLRDLVTFVPTRGFYRGQTIKGVLTKINRKTALVKTDFGSWKVSLALLKKA